MKTNSYADHVSERLQSDDNYVLQVLALLYDDQTDYEQQQQTTVTRNGRGFNVVDAKRLTHIAEAGLERGYLTPEELAECRRPDKHGRPALSRYWRQVQAAEEQGRISAGVPRKPPSSERFPITTETKPA